VAGATGRFRRSERLLRSSEYEQVAQQGRRAVSSAFVVLTSVRDGEAPSRLGITASRRVGNAVARNRVKRRIREWFRGARADWGRSRDVVVIARQPATLLAFEELNRQLSGLLKRAVEAS
jgi:ribonuclease P protein component